VGIQSLVVFLGITIALTAGTVAGLLGVGARGGAWLATGVVPVTWMLLYLTEQMRGREIWEYTAPYPYRSMEAPPS
jgi:hypothetical protein